MKNNRKARIEDAKMIGALFLTALAFTQGLRLLLIESIF